MKLDAEELRRRPLIGHAPLRVELIRRGFDADGLSGRAVLKRPEMVRDLLDEYVDAGATLLCTETLEANRLRMKGDPPGDDAAALVRAAVPIARHAADAARGTCRVAGQIGPSGRILALGEASETDLGEAFGEAAAALAAGGADLLLLAHFADLDELLIAVRAARRATGLPIVAAMIFGFGPDRTRTAAGAELLDAVERLVREGVAGVGCDCAGPEAALPLVRSMAGHADRPIFARINAADAEWEDGALVYRESAEAFASRAAELHRAGAVILAGCCGTTPAYVRALAAALAGKPSAPRRSGRRAP